MVEHAYKQMTLISNEYRKGKPATRDFSGSFFVKKNYDNSIDQFILTDFSRSDVLQYRIPLSEGGIITFDGFHYIIDSIFVKPGKKNIILRVSLKSDTHIGVAV